MATGIVRKHVFICLVAIMLYAHLTLLTDALVSEGVAHPTVCVGTQKSDFTMSNSVRLVTMMRELLAGCQYVIGDIHIIKINEQDFIDQGVSFDLSFLDSIQEITGCIKIVDSCFDKPISFKNLTVIRGVHCDTDAITIHFIDTCSMKIPPLDFRSLRYIGNGNVRVGGLKDCYIEKRVNYNELFFNSSRQSLSSKLQCLEKDSNCHPNCPTFPDGQQYCWGPGPDQCQQRSKCRSVSGCPTNRCFFDKLGGEQCCSESCLGGCFGATAKQCYGCARFIRDGTCDTTCSPGKLYDNANALLVESQEKFYPLGPVCVSKCPSSFFIADDSCVSKCSTGYSAAVNKTCIRTQPSWHCENLESALLCGKNNPLIVSRDNASQLCTEFTGDISIIDACFNDNSGSGLTKLKVEDLGYIFSRLTVVQGSIHVILSIRQITNLSFLSNLQKIDTSPRIKGSGRLFVSSDFVEYLGLSSLKYVANGILITTNSLNISAKKGAEIHFCTNFFPTKRALDDRIITHPEAFPSSMTVELFKKIRNGFLVRKCPFNPEKCHKECDSSYGCWGPSSDHCLKCLHLKAGSHCVSNCNAVSGWFEEIQAISTVGPAIADQQCSRCSKLCSKCYGSNDNECTECISTAFRDGTRCVEQCDLDYQYPDADQVCQSCPSVCVNLKNGVPKCTGNKPFVETGGCKFCTLVVPEIKNDGSHGLKCLNARQSCPVGYYIAVLNPTHVTEFPTFLQIIMSSTLSVSICLKCADHCLQCTGVAHICTECRYFAIKSIDDKSAKTTSSCTTGPLCPAGYFISKINKECQPCSKHCSVCSGPTDNDCTRCAERMLTFFPLGINNSTDFICVSSCPDSHPHQELLADYGITCSSSPSSSIIEKKLSLVKGAKLTEAVVGIVFCVILSMIIFILVFCYWFQQRNHHAKKCIRKRVVGWDEDMEPLNVTDAAPNVAILRTISEKEIVRGPEIGSGAFGTVFRGDWLPEGEVKKVSVAIKILSDSLSDCNVSSELLEESRIMASVEHAHCVRLVGICMTQPLQLITQFMPLGNLRDFLRARKDTDQIGSSHLLRYAAQIASGMSYLEQRSIIHRDLACRNVLVASTKSVKITDFGLAKLLDNPNEEYQASGGKLPVKWLALECLVSRKFSHKSDVWAYGVTLWEVFMFGDAPYVNVKPTDLADYLEKGERLPQPPICTLDVYIIMIKCWMLNETQRPTFEELESNFKKMAMDPGRYVYIKGDKYARNPSNESGSTEHRSANSSKSPSVNHLQPEQQLAPTDPDDCNYSALDAADIENDVFRGDASATSQSSAAQNSINSVHPTRHNSGEVIGAAASSAAAAATCAPSSSRQPRACQKGSQKYVNVKKPKPSSHNDNTYTSDPCKGSIEEHPMLLCSPLSQPDSAAHADDEYLRPIAADSSASQTSTSSSMRTHRQLPTGTLPQPCTSTVQNPEYFFNASRRQYHNVPVASSTVQNSDSGDEVGGTTPPQSHPLQLWVTTSRDPSLESDADDERNFTYV